MFLVQGFAHNACRTDTINAKVRFVFGGKLPHGLFGLGLARSIHDHAARRIVGGRSPGELHDLFVPRVSLYVGVVPWNEQCGRID